MALQRRKMKSKKPRTLGGQQLRELRRRTGLSLMDMAAKLESEVGKPIDAAHINKIETGSIKKPTVETLEAILAGLRASYVDYGVTTFGLVFNPALGSRLLRVLTRNGSAFSADMSTSSLCLHC